MRIADLVAVVAHDGPIVPAAAVVGFGNLPQRVASADGVDPRTMRLVLGALLGGCPGLRLLGGGHLRLRFRSRRGRLRRGRGRWSWRGRRSGDFLLRRRLLHAHDADLSAADDDAGTLLDVVGTELVLARAEFPLGPKRPGPVAYQPHIAERRVVEIEEEARTRLARAGKRDLA